MNNERKDLKTREAETTISSLIIKVSEGKKGCNQACDYCFSGCEVAKSANPFMSTETAIKAINIYWKMFGLAKQKTSPVVNFYGGEATLRKNIIRESTKYIRKLDMVRAGDETTIILNTNATLIDKEFAKFAKDNHFLVIVSLDGARDIHNIHRKFCNGKGSFDDVVKGIKILKNSGANVVVSTTLTRENFNDPNPLLEILKELDIEEFYAGPLLGKGLENSGIKEYAEKAAVSNLKYASAAKKFSIKKIQTCGENLSIASRVSGIDTSCPMNSNQIIVHPIGAISICKNMSEFTKIGDINTSIKKLLSSKLEMVEKLKQRLPAFNKECGSCKYKKICGGGCAFSAKEITGDIMKKDPVSCAYFQKTNEVLERRKLKEENKK